MGQGTAELHLQAPRRSRLTDESAAGGGSSGRSPRKQYRSAAEQISPLLLVRGGQLNPGSLRHSEYHSARIGVRQPPRVQWAAYAPSQLSALRAVELRLTISKPSPRHVAQPSCSAASFARSQACLVVLYHSYQLSTAHTV